MDENEQTVQNGIRSSATRGELAKALAKAQGEMQSAELNETGHFKKYADLTSIVRACRKPLSDNGLSVAQFPGRTENKIMELTTILMHDSGEWLEHTLSMPFEQPTPQKYGSAITYAKRYALAAVVGVVTGEDDDAEGTKPPAKTQKTQTPPPAKAVDKNGQDSRGDARPEGQAERDEFRPKPIKAPMITKTQLKKLNTLGSKVYNGEWDNERKRLVEWVTDQREDGPQVSSSKDLYRGEAARLIDGLEEKAAATE